MICVKCGTPIPEDAKFCPVCGVATAADTQTPPSGKTAADGTSPAADPQDALSPEIPDPAAQGTSSAPAASDVPPAAPQPGYQQPQPGYQQPQPGYQQPQPGYQQPQPGYQQPQPGYQQPQPGYQQPQPGYQQPQPGYQQPQPGYQQPQPGYQQVSFSYQQTNYQRPRYYCKNCGAPVTQNICPTCGADLSRMESVATPKSKVAAGLLGIFLGGLGVHNFYLGRITPAVIQLVMWIVGLFTTFFIVGGFLMAAANIWGLVEGIMILCGSINRDGHNIPLE